MDCIKVRPAIILAQGYHVADTFVQYTVNDILLDPRNAGVLAVIKAFRNGAVYGAKVRFPHALV